MKYFALLKKNDLFDMNTGFRPGYFLKPLCLIEVDCFTFDTIFK